MPGALELSDGHGSFTVPEAPAGAEWELLVLKAGLVSEPIWSPTAGTASAPQSGKDISHVILCHDDAPSGPYNPYYPS